MGSGITYRPRPGVTPEEEIRALVAVYRVVLRAHEEREKGALPGTRNDDVMEENHAHNAERIISE